MKQASSPAEGPQPAASGRSRTDRAAIAQNDEPANSSAEVSAVVLTLNESAHIGDCIGSLAWADRVIIFDAMSQDDTRTQAEAAGAEVLQAPFRDFAQQRNTALEAIETDWVFFVDADERATPALGDEVRRVVGPGAAAGWYVPRHNYIFGRLTMGAGWYPDYQLRLFRHGRVRYERPVHEIARVDGDIGYLETPLIHHNYRDATHFHEKQRRYSEYDAGILKADGVRPKSYTLLSQPLRHFWWRFASLKGYRDGLHGLKLSLFMAYYEWVKYRRLARLWAQGSE